VAAQHRLQLRQARHDNHEWQGKRRERTRHLIELGGLVVKADLVSLTDDDRAVILGLINEAAAMLRGETRETMLAAWRRRGRRLLAADRLPMESPCMGEHISGVIAATLKRAPA
jgi:hypothetical protein